MPSLGLSWGALRLLMAGTGTGAAGSDGTEAVPAVASRRVRSRSAGGAAKNADRLFFKF